jgi:hypothetical protein
MNSPTSPLLYPKEEKSPNSPCCSNHAHHKGLHANEQKLKDEGGDATRQFYRETRWSDEQPPWIVKDTIPDFIRIQRNRFTLDRICRSDREKSAWIPIPTDFHDVVQIFKDYGMMPRFYKIPHVMQFPEFVGILGCIEGQKSLMYSCFAELCGKTKACLTELSLPPIVQAGHH